MHTNGDTHCCMACRVTASLRSDNLPPKALNAVCASAAREPCCHTGFVAATAPPAPPSRVGRTWRGAQQRIGGRALGQLQHQHARRVQAHLQRLRRAQPPLPLSCLTYLPPI